MQIRVRAPDKSDVACHVLINTMKTAMRPNQNILFTAPRAPLVHEIPINRRITGTAFVGSEGDRDEHGKVQEGEYAYQ